MLFCHFSQLFTKITRVVNIILQLRVEECVILIMRKLQLLEQIDKLAALLHSDDLKELNLTNGTVNEIRQKLDILTEEYIECYC